MCKKISNINITIDKIQMNQEEEDNDLIVPFRPESKFLNFILKNKQISKVAYKQVIGCFLFGGLAFLIIGIVMLTQMRTVISVQRSYYTPNEPSCKLGASCVINFNIPVEMTPPIYLLYQLDDFYQNHRRYVQSKSNYQLLGNTIEGSDTKICNPFITNRDIKATKSWAGVPLDPNAVASPCGAIAYTFFNDSFTLTSLNSSPPRQIGILQNGITWPGDKGGKYRRSANSNITQWIDPQNEHFIVWMRTAGLPNFKKLWGRIVQNLPAGQYQMTINNIFNITQWSGNKYFILTTNSSMGGKNYLLPILFIIVSIASFTAVIIFWRKAIQYRKNILQN